jgi:ribonuclease P protein component
LKRHSLSSDERIKGKKSFDRIFSSGKTVLSTDKKLKAVYIRDTELNNPGVKIAAAVSSKAGNAVWRNRVKRLIKESYRLNKESIDAKCKKEHLLLRIVFSPNFLNEKKNKKISFQEILSPVLDIIHRIKNEI